MILIKNSVYDIIVITVINFVMIWGVVEGNELYERSKI